MKPPKKPMIDMTEPELRAYFDKVARLLESVLPPGPSANGKCLFVLLVTDTTGPGVMQYVSNAERAGIIKTLEEAAEKFRGGRDVTR